MFLINYYHNNCSGKRPNKSSLGKINYSYDYDRGTCWKLLSTKVFLSLCSSSFNAHTLKSGHERPWQFGGTWKIQISFKLPGKSIRISMHQNSNRLCSNDHILVKTSITKYDFPSILHFSFCIVSKDGWEKIKLRLFAEWWRWKILQRRNFQLLHSQKRFLYCQRWCI